jgi:8-oxo-dGTP pyrophosphatase MutT (NUDIX family)
MAASKPRKFKRLTRKVKRNAQAALRVCVRKKTHRPTAAVVLQYKKTRKFLVILSKDDGTGRNPGLAKGGVEVGETIFEAALRELNEEIGIERGHVAFRGYGGTRSVGSLKSKGGFAKKLYFLLYAVYSGSLELTVNPNELSGYDWLTFAELNVALAELRERRPDKERVLREAFAMIARNMKTKKKRKAGSKKTTQS